jgi:hypothetical protein
MRDARAEWIRCDHEAKELLATAVASPPTAEATLLARKARILVTNSNLALAKYIESAMALKEAVDKHGQRGASEDVSRTGATPSMERHSG